VNEPRVTIMSTIGVVLILLSASAPGASAAGTFKDCDDCPPMIQLPAGTFVMGTTDAAMAADNQKLEDVGDERPAHKVRVQSFALGAFEVTRKEFEAYIDATDVELSDPCWAFDPQKGFVPGPGLTWKKPGFAQTENDPVVCVSWREAQAYVAWLSKETGKRYRLPSEAEWEYAARAGVSSSRYWGPVIDERACRNANGADASAAKMLGLELAAAFPCDDGFQYTAPVGRFGANPFGFHDILGNVWEWTQDCLTKSSEGAPADGSAHDPADCRTRTLRGGSWVNSPRGVRAAIRGYDPPDAGFVNIGIRVARSD
jgi:sulfatase modifying factor 1